MSPHKLKLTIYHYLKLDYVLGIILLLTVCTVIAILSFSKPIDHIAALWSHALKPKLFFMNDGMGTWYYNQTEWNLTRNNYPPGLSLYASYLSVWAGEWHERASYFTPLLFNLASLILFSFAIYRKIKLFTISCLIAISLFMCGWFSWLIDGFYPIVMMIPLAIVGVGLLKGWIGNQSKSSIMLGSIFLFSMGWCKNEGLILALVLLSITMLQNFRPLEKGKLKYYFAGVTTLMPWILVWLIYDLHDSFYSINSLLNKDSVEIQRVFSTCILWIKRDLFIPPYFFSGFWWMILISVSAFIPYQLFKNKRIDRQATVELVWIIEVDPIVRPLEC